MIPRNLLLRSIEDALKHSPIVILLGPRQCGKTTIAREFTSRIDAAFFDLEDPECPLQPDRAKTILKDLCGLVVIDEVQLQPGLFSLLRVLVDDKNVDCKYLLLGSASPKITRGVSESLAGRVTLLEISGFGIDEISIDQYRMNWTRGGFPLSFLAESDAISFEWRKNFVKTFLERDIPQLGIRVPAVTLRRFWTMLAHYHGNIWNAADLARAMGTKEDTARHYLDILSGTYIIRQLPPWYENIGKRLVKSPKVYFRDTGLLHFLLGIQNRLDILSHPKLGFSWEGYCIEQTVRILNANDNAYFFATYSGAELDLLIFQKGKRIGFEFKYVDSPKVDKSMNIILNDLSLHHLYVVYPGTHAYPLKEKISVLPFDLLSKLVDILN